MERCIVIYVWRLSLLAVFILMFYPNYVGFFLLYYIFPNVYTWVLWVLVFTLISKDLALFKIALLGLLSVPYFSSALWTWEKKQKQRMSLLGSVFEVFGLFIPEANVLFLKISPEEQVHGDFLTKNQGLLKCRSYWNSEKADESQEHNMHNNNKKEKDHNYCFLW